MKRIIAVILLVALTLSLCACNLGAHQNLVDTEWEQVEALVVDTQTNGRWGWKYITVSYEGTKTQWQNDALHDYYVNRHGETITCTLVVYTYEDGHTESELLFNEDLWNKGDS